MKVRIGLGALSNKHFDNALFPLRTPHAEYIPRYTEVLDHLELAQMYHTDELPDKVLEWSSQAPRGFTFTAKLWKQACNPQDKLGADLPWDDDAQDAARTSMDALQPLRDAGQLGPVVVQFPARFTATEAHRDWLDDVLDMEPTGTFAVEFRDPAWFTDDTKTFLKDRKTQLVWGTHPKAFAPDWNTGPRGVVRLTGKHHKSKETRGRPVWVEDRLEDVLRMRKMLADQPWKECFVSVLNPFEGNAIDSIPRVAGAFVDAELGRRLSRKPGDALFKHPPGGPKQTGLGGF